MAEEFQLNDSMYSGRASMASVDSSMPTHSSARYGTADVIREKNVFFMKVHHIAFLIRLSVQLEDCIQFLHEVVGISHLLL